MNRRGFLSVLGVGAVAAASGGSSLASAALTPALERELLVVGSIAAEKIAAGAITSTKIAASSVTTGMIAVGTIRSVSALAPDAINDKKIHIPAKSRRGGLGLLSSASCN